MYTASAEFDMYSLPDGVCGAEAVLMTGPL